MKRISTLDEVKSNIEYILNKTPNDFKLKDTFMIYLSKEDFKTYIEHQAVSNKWSTDLYQKCMFAGITYLNGTNFKLKSL